MRKFIYNCIFSLTILPALFNPSGCDGRITLEQGVLEGTISIGPICPVETDPPRPECLPTAETYKAYPVGIWTADGGQKVAQLSPALDGSFSIELDPGEYLIKLDKDNSIGGGNLPLRVEVITLEKTTVSIDIDTGIR
jgi:hypothetical protein